MCGVLEWPSPASLHSPSLGVWRSRSHAIDVRRKRIGAQRTSLSVRFLEARLTASGRNQALRVSTDGS